jgi:DNA-binding NtrC family response regulator
MEPYERCEGNRVTGQSVLVIDDEDAVRGVLTRMLQASGYATTSAPNAAAAIACFNEGQRFDLVICDQRMPAMSGNECLQHIWTMVPEQRVLRVAGASQDAEEAAEALGRRTPVLVKPFTMQQLLDSVRNAIASDS